MIKLDIMSDPICPWCYIGKRNLDMAFAETIEHPFTIEWHPFQLNPEMPREGMDRRAYLEGKFGGKAQAVQVYGRIDEYARAAVLELNLRAIKRTPNTLDAHRLIHWAGLEHRQTPVVSALFQAYFHDGKDISAPDVLLEAAQFAEMNTEVVSRLLDSDADITDIQNRDAHARQRGVTGVPTFVIDNQHVLTGAQPPETWVNVIKEIQEQLSASE